MKSFLIYSMLFYACFGFSQQWKDSLQTARKLYKEGKYVASLEKYKAAQKTAPKNVDLSDEMAQSAYKSNEFKQAEKLYKQSSSKKASADQKAKTYHNIGNAKLKQKNYKEAVEAYKEALRSNPKDEETRYNLAEAMKKQKSQDKNKQENKEKNEKQQNQQQQQNKPEEKKQQENQNKEEKQNSEQNQASQKEQKSQLDDKKTDRMLDDLVKKEMETKKKLGNNKGKNKSSKTGKDW